MNNENLQNWKETVQLQDLGIDKEDSTRRDLKSTRWDGMYWINIVQKRCK
jgi:hypothetical protein